MKLASALVPVSRRPKRFLITSLGPRGPTDLAPSLAAPEGLAQWLPGFHRAVPSTPLDASGYVLCRRIAKRPGRGAPGPLASHTPRDGRYLGYAAGVASVRSSWAEAPMGT